PLEAGLRAARVRPAGLLRPRPADDTGARRVRDVARRRPLSRAAPTERAVTSLASARGERLAAGVVVVLLVVWGGLYVARTSFEITGGARVFTLWDDGMISMTYARNLARGHGLVWNPGEQPVQGFSNPGVTLAMAAIHLLPIDARHTSL